MALDYPYLFKKLFELPRDQPNSGRSAALFLKIKVRNFLRIPSLCSPELFYFEFSNHLSNGIGRHSVLHSVSQLHGKIYVCDIMYLFEHHLASCGAPLLTIFPMVPDIIRHFLAPGKYPKHWKLDKKSRTSLLEFLHFSFFEFLKIIPTITVEPFSNWWKLGKCIGKGRKMSVKIGKCRRTYTSYIIILTSYILSNGFSPWSVKLCFRQLYRWYTFLDPPTYIDLLPLDRPFVRPSDSLPLAGVSWTER